MKIRDAITADIPALEQVTKPAIIHGDRIRDAAHGQFRYLVLVDEKGEIVGHAILVFQHPKAWPPDEEDTPYPRVIDLMIRKQRRAQGLGKEFMRQMESICRQMGYKRLHLSVDPEGNADALKFYLRLGYKAMHDEPRWRKWSFKDSQGNVHQGEGPELDMFKEIA